MSRFAMPLLFVAAILLTGCVSQQLGHTLRVAQTSERPAELDRLQVFIGTWQGEAEERVIETDQVTRYEGRSTMTWEAGGRVMLERSDITRNGQPESHIALTTWDPNMGRYRLWGFDSTGLVVDAASWEYVEADNSWRRTVRIGDALMEGVLHVSPDGNQIDSSYVIRARDRNRIIAEGRATARRAP